MQKYFIYSLCSAIQSSQSLGSNPQSCWIASLECSSGNTQDTDYMCTFAFLPLQCAWVGPSWMHSLLQATRRCLEFLCVSVVLVHLERHMIGEFPILVSWRNIPSDIKLLWRINFFSDDWFFWFDSITSKLLLMHVHELNYASLHTISCSVLLPCWLNCSDLQKILICKSRGSNWNFLMLFRQGTIALNFLNLELSLLLQVTYLHFFPVNDIFFNTNFPFIVH